MINQSFWLGYDFFITRKRTEPSGAISSVELSKYNPSTGLIVPIGLYSKESVARGIQSGERYATAMSRLHGVQYVDSAGSEVHVVRRKGAYSTSFYLRTDANDTPEDNLANLPEV